MFKSVRVKYQPLTSIFDFLSDVFEFIVNKSRLIALARVVPPWKEPGASYFNLFYMKFLGNKMADFEFRGVPIVEIQMQISKKLQVSSSANKQKCER